MAQDTSTWIELRTARLAAGINPLGAQLSTLRDAAGHDLLWDGEPSVWAGRAPILFPIVGTLAGGTYRLGSNAYALPRHGFARGRAFEVVRAADSRAVFRLVSDESTLKVYPFKFQLDVSFALDGAALMVVSTVRNTGNVDMPASIGYHPGLRWPLPYGQARDSHYIEFASEEPAPIRRLDKDGLVTPHQHPTPVSGRRLHLEDALFRDDVVIFDEIASRSLTYGATAGPRIRVDFPDARYLGVWTRPGAGFICIEPWQGIADYAGTPVDFTKKPGVFNVAPGRDHSLSMRLTLLEESGQN
jgi:galactose mutarotase-like enzyme